MILYHRPWSLLGTSMALLQDLATYSALPKMHLERTESRYAGTPMLYNWDTTDVLLCVPALTQLHIVTLLTAGPRLPTINKSANLFHSYIVSPSQENIYLFRDLSINNSKFLTRPFPPSSLRHVLQAVHHHGAHCAPCTCDGPPRVR